MMLKDSPVPVRQFDASQPPLSQRHPQYQKALTAFDQMDACWLNGDLDGFRSAIATIKNSFNTQKEERRT